MYPHQEPKTSQEHKPQIIPTYFFAANNTPSTSREHLKAIAHQMQHTRAAHETRTQRNRCTPVARARQAADRASFARRKA